VKKYGQYRRNASWIVKRWKKGSWMVKRYEKYGRKLWNDMKYMEERQVE
jgi:hypothetical protein